MYEKEQKCCEGRYVSTPEWSKDRKKTQAKKDFQAFTGKKMRRY